MAAFAAVGLVVGAYFHGRSTMADEKDKEYAEQSVRRQAMISGLALELAKRSGESAENIRKLNKELEDVEQKWKDKKVIKRYVPDNPDRKRNCPVTSGWVQYHDERAAGLPPNAGPEPGVAEAPSGIEDAQVLETVGDNYAAYFRCKARVKLILEEFDKKRGTFNTAVDTINKTKR